MYEAYIDASRSHNKKCGVGYALLKDGIVLAEGKQPVPEASSGKLEYEALFHLFDFLESKSLKDIIIKTDSKGIVDGLNNYLKNKTKRRKKKTKFELIHSKMKHFNSTIKWIPRKENKIADRLSREATVEEKPLIKTDDLEDQIRRIQLRYENKRKQKQLYETKMVIRHRSSILFRCITCNENKPATEYPRFRKGKKRRTCYTCEGILNELHFN